MAYVITVEFILKSGSMAAFRKLMDENARNSFDFEPGCLRFDVLVPLDCEDKIFLYEIYSDKAAFETHLKTEHFQTFNRKSNDLVQSRTIAEFKLVCEASNPKE